MPKLTKGIINGPTQTMQARNSAGTSFKIKLTDKNKDGTYMADKWICAPGDQVIDMAAWLQELLVVVKASAK